MSAAAQQLSIDHGKLAFELPSIQTGGSSSMPPRFFRVSFVQQVALFSKAQLVIGAHGAGLGNLLFSGRNCRVVTVENKRNQWLGFDKMFSRLAEKIGMRVETIICNEVIKDEYESDFIAIRNRDLIVDSSVLNKLLLSRLSNAP